MSPLSALGQRREESVSVPKGEALYWCEVVTGQSTGQGKNITDRRGLLFCAHM